LARCRLVNLNGLFDSPGLIFSGPTKEKVIISKKKMSYFRSSRGNLDPMDELPVVGLGKKARENVCTNNKKIRG
jgi:hypothetical protein